MADALAGRREKGVEHGGRRDADRRLADPAPETAASSVGARVRLLRNSGRHLPGR